MAARTRCYGWSPVWEFQVLAGAGIGVFYSNPRGSEGYGRGVQRRQPPRLGPRPTRDVLGGRGRRSSRTAWRTRTDLGVTGGSYGGYLTNWIVGS